MASSVNMDQSLDQSLTHTMDSVTGAAVAGVNITNDEDDSSSGESSSDEDGDENGDDNGDDNGNENAPHLYNPNKYKHLQVSQEIQDLFDHIGRHKPQDIELDTHLKPFIPDYIPAVGEIDAFLKIPKPDGKEDLLGLNVLDEPAARQSHPSVLQIELRMLSKKNHLQNEAVGSIENADKHGKKITTWIQKIEELHRKKPPPHVHYSKTMPDIEQLMQVWPPGFEEVLKNTNLPSADLDMDVKSFAQMVCALLDIPVYEKTTESLHVLFTLYSEFKNNSHFNHE